MMSATGLFKRLEIRHEFEVPQSWRAAYSFGEVKAGTYRGLFYDHAESHPLELIPLEHRHHFQCMLMRIDLDWVPPHVDNQMQTAINFYIETADAVTTFYRAKPKHRRRRLHNQTSGYIVHDEDVDPVASFKAEPGEVFVLNVAALHSVRSARPALRVAYQLQTSLPFERVLEIMGASDAAAG